jgi:hypothetical protein
MLGVFGQRAACGWCCSCVDTIWHTEASSDAVGEAGQSCSRALPGSFVLWCVSDWGAIKRVGKLGVECKHNSTQ